MPSSCKRCRVNNFSHSFTHIPPPSRFKLADVGCRPSSIILHDLTENLRHSLCRRAPASAAKSKSPSNTYYRGCLFIKNEHVQRAASLWPASFTSGAPSSLQACSSKNRKLNLCASPRVVRGACKQNFAWCSHPARKERSQ